MSGLGGEQRLIGARLVKTRAVEQQRQARRRRRGVDPPAAGFSGRGLILPFRHAGPHVEAVAAPGPSDRGRTQRADGRRGPRPTCAPQGLGLGERLLATGRGPGGEFGQQGLGHAAQRRGLDLGLPRLRETKGQAEPHRRGGAEPRRPHEGEQLEDVEEAWTAGRGVEAEAARGHRGVSDQHRPGFEEIPRLGHADGPGARAVGHRRPAARQHDQGRREIEGWRGGVHRRGCSAGVAATERERGRAL